MGETGNGHDDQSLDIRGQEKPRKKVPLGFRDSRGQEETDSLAIVLERRGSQGAHTCLPRIWQAAPGMRWLK